jgi:hypothetical protein
MRIPPRADKWIVFGVFTGAGAMNILGSRGILYGPFEWAFVCFVCAHVHSLERRLAQDYAPSRAEPTEEPSTPYHQRDVQPIGDRDDLDADPGLQGDDRSAQES